MKSLLSYKDPRTNMPVVTKIMTREEAFPGKATEEAPDLTLTLRDGGFVSILKADEVVKARQQIGGTHSPEGIFVARGKNLQKGLALPPQTILDVAPTLLYAINLPIPEDFEGKVITEAFDPQFLRANPVRIGASTIPSAIVSGRDHADGLEGSDEREILERLKALGYLE
jgi:predicted AlkP superfamily phosphohydrolase/phosphomutase